MRGNPGIVIVGGGIAGLATAWWLGRHGVTRVTLVEREAQLGLHSSGRNASILRTALGSAATRRMALETGAFLAHPPAGFAERPLLERCGLVVVVARDAHPGWARSPGGPLEELDDAALGRLAPWFRPSSGRALYLPEEGRIDTRLLVQSLADGARRAGVELRLGCAVDELIVRSGGVRGVRLAGGEELEADWTVLAAGGWAGRLGRRAGSTAELAPTRRHLAVTAPDERVDPTGPIVWSDVDGFYARPEAGGLLLSACDTTPIDPDRCEPDPLVRAEIARRAARHLPALAPSPIQRFWAGIRTLTPDDRALVGADASVPGLFWVAGLGGHGMTTSIATGRLAAQALRGEPPRAPDPDCELARALDPSRARSAVRG